MRVIISGGAGFVGSHLAEELQSKPGNRVVVLDNLRRRGSELNLAALESKGITFFHGDIREMDDLLDLPGNFDLMIEASAEPSVHAGENGSPAYVIGTNLRGTLNCLEFARRRAGSFQFLSTSRVYSISSLRGINLVETQQRFEIAPEQTLPGISENGISEDFPTNKARSFYGATKLASEFLMQEYVETYGLKAVANRCGVIAGPGQFGKVDQGIFTLWVVHHYFNLPLKYTGFGGQGKQVRDLLHPSDLADLLIEQVDRVEGWQGDVFNVGGGRANSVSMREMTVLCCEIVGNKVDVGGSAATAAVDVPLYLTDCRKLSKLFSWHPRRDVNTIISETLEWICKNEKALKPIFGVTGN